MKLTQTLLLPLMLAITIAVLSACKPADEPKTSAVSTPEAVAVPDQLRVRYSVIDLAELNDPVALTSRCEAESVLLREHLQQLEASTGKPTIDGYYESLNSLSSSLTNLNYTTQSLSGVHPDAAVREAAEACVQQLSEISTDIGLSRKVYDAISQIESPARIRPPSIRLKKRCWLSGFPV